MLGTPPAFILSQDQTLILKFGLASFSLLILKRDSVGLSVIYAFLPACVVLARIFWKSFRLFPTFILEFSGLFYYLIIKVVRWLFASAYYILPHLFALVNNFFYFFEFLFCQCFLLCGSEIYITTLSSLCQQLFSIFWNSFLSSYFSFVRQQNLYYHANYYLSILFWNFFQIWFRFVTIHG